MKFYLSLLTLIAVQSFGQSDTTQQIISGRQNSAEQQKKPYVILISADGFRNDYAVKHNATFLQKMGEEGVSANYMLPSYPSLTFPNHYTLVTGLYPSHHGLVGNHFYDPALQTNYSMSNSTKVRSGEWYGGTPLWVLAEQQQMLSASFYWVGSEAPIQGIIPTYYYKYNEAIDLEKRIQVVIDWLKLPEERRPHFIGFYFPEVDHAGHSYGPDSNKTGEAVRWIDTAMHKLTEAVKATNLDVNYIFVSDHGMTKVDTENWIITPRFDTAEVVVATGGEIVQLYVKDKSQIGALYQSIKDTAKGFNVYQKKEMPAKLHYGQNDDWNNRIGDIILIPEWPLTFSSGRKPKPGAHGYDPYKVPDMRAVFYAWGPAFKSNKKIKKLNNVDVFPIVTSILGLNHVGNIDGSNKVAKKILK